MGAPRPSATRVLRIGRLANVLPEDLAAGGREVALPVGGRELGQDGVVARTFALRSRERGELRIHRRHRVLVAELGAAVGGARAEVGAVPGGGDRLVRAVAGVGVTGVRAAAGGRTVTARASASSHDIGRGAFASDLTEGLLICSPGASTTRSGWDMARLPLHCGAPGPLFRPRNRAFWRGPQVDVGRGRSRAPAKTTWFICSKSGSSESQACWRRCRLCRAAAEVPARDRMR